METRLGSKRLGSRCALVFVSLVLGGQVRADPLPGEAVLKFQQLPLGGADAVFLGHDETSTAFATRDAETQEPTGWQGTFMADDFADGSGSPIVHVGWWGSYAADFTGNRVQEFLISFESDVPAGDGGASHPGDVLSSQIVRRGPLAPGSGTFTEGPPTGSLYHYNAELNFGQSFPEQPDTVYWLKIVALVDTQRDGSISWGWHDRDWSIPDALASTAPAVTPGEGVVGSLAPGVDVHHFQDDAVSGSISIAPGLGLQQSDFTPTRYLDGLDGPAGIEQFSKDLAFELYTVPEPGSGPLLALGVAALGAASRQRRRLPR